MFSSWYEASPPFWLFLPTFFAHIFVHSSSTPTRAHTDVNTWSVNKDAFFEALVTFIKLFLPELVWSRQKWSLVCRSSRRSRQKRLLMVRMAAARARLHSVSPTGRKRERVRETASVWLSPRTHPFYRTGLDRLKWYSKKVTSTSLPPCFLLQTDLTCCSPH